MQEMQTLEKSLKDIHDKVKVVEKALIPLKK